MLYALVCIVHLCTGALRALVYMCTSVHWYNCTLSTGDPVHKCTLVPSTLGTTVPAVQVTPVQLYLGVHTLVHPVPVYTGTVIPCTLVQVHWCYAPGALYPAPAVQYTLHLYPGAVHCYAVLHPGPTGQ